jgi:hypothetical protein
MLRIQKENGWQTGEAFLARVSREAFATSPWPDYFFSLATWLDARYAGCPACKALLPLTAQKKNSN